MRRALIALALLTALQLTGQEQYQEQITVERILLDARVTDFAGEPVLGLTTVDFTVKVGGKPAQVESVEWIPETIAAREIAAIHEETRGELDMPAPKGRLLVFFFQTDFARNTARITGQMHALPYAEKIVELLEPEDRVAVLSFDSHLKFRLDFSSDDEKVRDAITASLRLDEPRPPDPVPLPSLAKRLDPAEMKRMASSEQALILLGNALRQIPGPKSLILFGWGLGKRQGRAVTMTAHYQIAKRVLESARVTVFALDTTMADAHDLEVGLHKAAADTGGFYAKTHVFPQLAIDRLERTLQGHYEIEVRRPAALRPGTHDVEVQVKRRGVVVLARSSFMDKG